MRAIANIGEYFSPAVPHLCRYWLEKSAGRAGPSRQEIDALDMPKRSLPYVMLVDIERAPFRVKYRLVGTGIASLFSLDFGGLYLDQLLMPGTYREEAQALYQGVSETAEPVVGHYGYPTSSGKLILSEFAILPLISNGFVSQCLAVEHLDARTESFPGDIVPLRLG